MGGFKSTTTDETKSYEERQNPLYTHIKADHEYAVIYYMYYIKESSKQQ